MLIPKDGYIRTVDENGRPCYKATPQKERELKEAAEKSAANNDLAAMTVDHEYRLTLLELGVTEGGEA